MNLTNTVESITPIIRGLIKDQSRNDGRDVFSYYGDDKFTLSESFINESSIKIHVNNELVSDDNWTYNDDTNQILYDAVDSGTELNDEDVIVITYSYYKNFSDTEIKGYIQSALTYFPIHHYLKTFLLDDDDIVAINNLKPTVNELYLICIISAILIDPQNINIDVDGTFKVSANRDKSDEQQIKEIFSQYRRFSGKLSFEKICTAYNK
jgi:hypothetical protein